MRYGAEGLAVGDRVGLLARLQPPPGPSLPGGFDFARQAYFQGLGGIGFALGKPAVLETAPHGGLSLTIADLRSRIGRRLAEVAPGDAGAMAAALLTGLRAGISDGVWRDMQRSSLAHLLSISGLHMALVASTIFLALRYGLALVPPLALRVTIKKLAALGALAGATFYLLLSGASVPAQRSYLMVAAGLARDPRRPPADLDAASRLRRHPRAGAAAGEPARRLLPALLRGRAGAGRRLRDGRARHPARRRHLRASAPRSAISAASASPPSSPARPRHR